jgi:drug/metabolite transporter (DMT)-like permease
VSKKKDMIQATRGNAGYQSRAVPALLCGATGIAFAPIFVRLSQAGPSATAFWRIALALPFLGLWYSGEKKRNSQGKNPETWSDYAAFFLAGLFFAGDLAVWHWSIKFTTVANATLLANFSPIFVTLGARVLFRERVTRKFLAGMILALAGAITLVGSSFQLSSRHVAGDILGISTAVFYAGYLLTVNRLRCRYTTASIMTFSGISCAFVLLIVTLASEKVFVPQEMKGWYVLLGLALVSQLMGQGLITYALAYLSTPFASVGLLVQPVLAAILAWLLLRESMGFLQCAGGVIVLAGILIARRGSPRP